MQIANWVNEWKPVVFFQDLGDPCVRIGTKLVFANTEDPYYVRSEKKIKCG